MEIKMEPELIIIDDNDDESDQEFSYNHPVETANTFFYPNQMEFIDSKYSEYVSNSYCSECGGYSTSFTPHKDGCSKFFKTHLDMNSETPKGNTPPYYCHQQALVPVTSSPQREILGSPQYLQSYVDQRVGIPKPSYDPPLRECFGSVSDTSDERIKTKVIKSKQYPCSLCHNVFGHRSLWLSHKKYICTKKKLVCQKCCFRFFSNGHLMKHQLEENCIVRPFICYGCQNHFSKRKGLRRHQKSCKAPQWNHNRPGLI